MVQVLTTASIAAIALLGLILVFAPGADAARRRARGVGLLSIAAFLAVVAMTLASSR
ncbi:MAG: hypothetical protein HYU87_04965 [Chloroflexi bacterium]|nr:hypothetical protein [Chloroflexota bacterium]